jgi:diguanylate cyclase (GGDEF)-like protein
MLINNSDALLSDDLFLRETDIDEAKKFYSKKISKNSKDNFILYNIKDNYLEIMGNIVSDINKNKKYSSKLTLVEAFEKIYEEDVESIKKKIESSIINGRAVDVEFRIKSADDLIRWVSLKLKSFKNDKEDVISYFGYLHDITFEKIVESKLKNLIEFDELTKLPSSYYIEDKVNECLSCTEKQEARGALLLINIDNFKMINDSFSHKDGDRLLEAVAKQLVEAIHRDDLICRYSGDEFIIFKSEVDSINSLDEFANRVKKIFEKPFNIKTESIHITASIGIALSPDNGNDFNHLLKNADSAMVRAKTNGKDICQLFDNSISTELNRTFAIQKCLRKALDNDELFVAFQPKVILNSSIVNGFEALIRWNNSELGLVGPNEFIPVAESTRLIIPIGRFVLEEAFKKVKTLLDEGFKDFKIAVNFSEVQFRYGDIVSDFNKFSKKYKISPEYIEMEITESILIKTVEDNISKLDAVKKLGVSIALDDFGTGYSSLNYLTKLPIDVLKIDRSFVIDLIENKKSRCIVENIINLSHQLGIDVVAEGVEDLEQVEYLKGILCDTVQGFYFSKPGDFDIVKKLLGKKL